MDTYNKQIESNTIHSSQSARNKRVSRQRSTPFNAEQYITVREIAELLSVSRAVVLKWVKSNKFAKVLRLPGKTGDIRIPISSYQAFLKSYSD